MKIIDIHTKKEAVAGKYKNPISPELTKEYVYQNISFNLPENLWEIIESAFSYIWNDKLGIGNYFYWDEVPVWVYSEVKKQLRNPYLPIEKHHVLLSFGCIDEIVTLILSYIKSMPSGVLE